MACVSVPRPRIEGPLGYHDLMIRARKQIEGRLKGGRIIVKIQNRQGMILFLTPINQVVLKLEVANEDATLFNPRCKCFWKGLVSEMLDQLWGLPVSWDELVILLLEGRIPSGREDLGQLKIIRLDGQNWQEAELFGPQGLWRFNVIKRFFNDQALPGRQDLTGWTEKPLGEVAGDVPRD